MTLRKWEDTGNWRILEMGGYWKLEEEALDRPLWSNSFKRGYGCVLVIASKEAMDVS